ncbi:unnamed protein product [Miscanthus lutarioriparius]|uniref:Protein kinase domain-containing protein n=1 Tax=Miscanthus lutarioriparius TaxID=422564 RepID=A0A811Q4B6_9POAL|nr:unnamed protein product [Miscanthus lutarioriparius]
MYNLSSLKAFHVEGNQLHDSIPANVGSKFPAMEDFSLANNRFTRRIPSSLSNLTTLTSLQLSINEFTGLVPRDIGRLEHLQILYLSHNLLEAADTESWDFVASLANCSNLLQLSLSDNSFSGQLPRSVGEVPNGGVFGNLTAISITGNSKLCGGMPQLRLAPCSTHPQGPKSQAPPTAVTQEHFQRVTYQALLRGTDGFSESNLLGKGRYGSVYKCSLQGEDTPTPVAVKVFNLQQSGSSKSFQTECEALRRPPVVHCDVKPSNILLAEDMSARVGDFGISRILFQSANIAGQNSNSTIGIRGSIGYSSLGILLLEMFTGRSPTDDMFTGSLDLHKFSEAALPNKILEIADPAIWVQNDASDKVTRSRVQESLISVIRIGISCSKQQPRERMPIRDAAVEMHAIRDANLRFASSLVVEHAPTISSYYV